MSIVAHPILPIEFPAWLHTLAQLDWCLPWFAPHTEASHLAEQTWQQQGCVWRGLQQLGEKLGQADSCAVQLPLPNFVPQTDLPATSSYEAFIHETRQVPTRDNLHDFFNGLMWHSFPRAKTRLNQLQAQQIAQQGIGAHRGPVRDACTLLDENGALLLAPEPLWQALRQRNWMRLFWDLRPLWAQARLLIIGHALLEQLCMPRKPITAHVLTLPLNLPAETPTEACTLAQIDQALANILHPETLTNKPFTPLPVLGIPNWHPDNAQQTFYSDTSVFRPARAKP